MDRYQFEKKLWQEGFGRVMGLDEVGVACLSGPVVAAGVILKPDSVLDEKVADSKTLNGATRERLAAEIKERALFWTIQSSTPQEIDRLNIHKATINAMMRCVEVKGASPDFLLVDGNRFTSSLIPFNTIVKGDNKSVSIAAASIIAKVHRDQLMKRLHDQFPHFGWNTNVGYPTAKHFQGLEEHGYTEHHRKSFNLRTTRKYATGRE
ncbi:MAG: ribonuclease HII [Bacteroidetes bacterium]|jgi:ribonuclease HII|nr:ribonuclease HII [Bacteroidota bacterium]